MAFIKDYNDYLIKLIGMVNGSLSWCEQKSFNRFNGYLVFNNKEDETGDLLVTPRKISKAIDTILEDIDTPFDTEKQTAIFLSKKYHDIEYLDSDIVSDIVQVAMFNDIIYG